MLALTMIHDLIVTFPEDSQGGKASYVVVPAQVHLSSAVNLRLRTTPCLPRCPVGDDEEGGGGGGNTVGEGADREGRSTAYVAHCTITSVVYGALPAAQQHHTCATGQAFPSALPGR